VEKRKGGPSNPLSLSERPSVNVKMRKNYPVASLRGGLGEPNVPLQVRKGKEVVGKKIDGGKSLTHEPNHETRLRKTRGPSRKVSEVSEWKGCGI